MNPFNTFIFIIFDSPCSQDRLRPGDLLPNVLFLIGSEPLNRLIANSFLELIYIPQEGITIGPILFVDDNLSPLSLTCADQVRPILALSDRYTVVRGLNINVWKSAILCINYSPELTHELQHKGFSTHSMIRHLGLELATDINIIMKETLHKIDLKDVKRHILAAASPTDIVHRASMNNSAMTPLYNHVLMALPSTDEDFQPLDKEILSFP